MDSAPESTPLSDFPKEAPHHHQTYYINDEPIIFLVENTLFKVHRHFLIQESDVFRGMFESPPATVGPEGGSDERPVILPGVLSREFERLLDFFYRGEPIHDALSIPGTDGRSLALERWSDLLSISTRFDFRRIRRRAIETIETISSFEPTEKYRLAVKYDIPHWKIPALVTRCQCVDPLEMEEAAVFGLADFTWLTHAREAVIRDHYRHQSRKGKAFSNREPEGGKYDVDMVRDIVLKIFNLGEKPLTP